MNTKRYIVTSYDGQKYFTTYRLAKVFAKSVHAKTRNSILFKGQSVIAIITKRPKPSWLDGFSAGQPVYVLFKDIKKGKSYKVKKVIHEHVYGYTKSLN